MASATPIVLPGDARRALEDRARRDRVTVSRAAAEIICAELGADLPPRTGRVLARDGVPEVVRLAARDGGVTVAEAVRELGVPESTARSLLAKARAGRMATARRGRAASANGKRPLVYRATALGREVAAG